MYYEDELYDDSHCECGNWFDDYGFCPACDGIYWEGWVYENELESEETE